VTLCFLVVTPRQEKHIYHLCKKVEAQLSVFAQLGSLSIRPSSVARLAEAIGTEALAFGL
jgi:hypothetical protein